MTIQTEEEDCDDPARLVGFGLVDAFGRHVFCDPGSEALRDELWPRFLRTHIYVASGTREAVTAELLFSNLDSERNAELKAWQRKDSRNQWRMRRGIEATPIGQRPLEREITDDERTTLAAITHRFNQLLDWIRDGVLIMDGKPGPGGARETVDQPYWCRVSLKLDLGNGDLYEGIGSRKVIKYEAIAIRAIAGTGAAGYPGLPKPNPGPPRMQAAIIDVIQEFWPSGLPVGLHVQKRNDQIKRRLVDDGLSAPSDKTISRAITRLRKDKGQ